MYRPVVLPIRYRHHVQGLPVQYRVQCSVEYVTPYRGAGRTVVPADDAVPALEKSSAVHYLSTGHRLARP
eukprot:3918817-Rhodomonas_salina.2